MDPDAVRWQASEGALADVVSGRWVLFLARNPGEDARDVWRARVRVSPDGSAVEILGAYDLTSTPIGDDHELVVRDDHAAFATRAYGQEQGVTVLGLLGEGEQNKTTALSDRTMAAITNLQRTGSASGVGRVDVTFESPARAVGLALGEDALDLTLFGSDARRTESARVDLASGELVPALPRVRADASMHLPKRLSHWVVDTLRAEPWVGPVPVAWVEDQALALRDAYRRITQPSGWDPLESTCRHASLSIL